MTKNNFYDTSSLLLKAGHLFDDDEENIYISSITLEELEKIKTSSNKDAEVKFAARQITRELDEYWHNFYIIQFKPEFLIGLEDYEINNDLKIISCAVNAKPDNFITNDLCCRNLARIILPSYVSIESYENSLPEYTGYKEIYINQDELIDFYEEPLKNNFALYINEYLILRDKETKEVLDIRVWNGEEYQYINSKPINSKWFGKVNAYKGDIYQKLAIDSLYRNQLTVFRGSAGVGKAQPNSTKIPTKDGYKILGDIKPGDKILDRFGKETTVLGVFPQGLKENYKVTFSDGRVAYCNDEHIWSCYTSKKNLKDFTVKEMLDKGLKIQCDRHYRFKIPLNKPVEFEEKNLPIDPYVMGAFLGDGCCKEMALTLSSNDEEIVKEIASKIGASYHKESDKNYNWKFLLPEEKQIRGKTGQLITHFQTREFFKGFEKEILCYAYEKSIPNIYKKGSISQRYALLQGLLDTDGTIDNIKKGRVRFTSTSLKLILDIQEICWSLGLKASYSQESRIEKYTLGACYNLTISCPRQSKINLFRLSRKKEIAIAHSKEKTRSIFSNTLSIIDIEKMPHLEEMTCLYVDNPEHLYLTEQYIVTHNTLLGLSYLFSLLEDGKIDKIYIFCNPVATKDAAKLGLVVRLK